MSAPRRFNHYEAARLYESGLSTLEVAAQLGVSKVSVFHALRRLGVPTRTLAEAQEKHKRHGIGRYRAGCRCDICRVAVREAKRRQRARNPEYVARELAAKKRKRAAA